MGLVQTNPVSASKPLVPKKRQGIGLTVVQKDMLIAAATGPWCIPLFLEMAVGLGARRGEVLALRWTDIVAGRAFIGRSLSQANGKLEFTGTKTDEPRVAKIREAPWRNSTQIVCARTSFVCNSARTTTVILT